MSEDRKHNQNVSVRGIVGGVFGTIVPSGVGFIAGGAIGTGLGFVLGGPAGGAIGFVACGVGGSFVGHKVGHKIATSKKERKSR